MPRMPLERVWPDPPPIYASIAGEPSAVLAEFPMPTAPLGYFFDTRYLYFSTFHWHPHRQRQQRLLPEVVRRADRARAGLPVRCGRRVPADPRRRLRRGARRVLSNPAKFAAHRGDARRAAGHAAGRGRAVGRQRVAALPAATVAGLRLRAQALRARSQEPRAAEPESVLDAGNERPDLRDVHLLDRDGLEIGLRRGTRSDRDPT